MHASQALSKSQTRLKKTSPSTRLRSGRLTGKKDNMASGVMSPPTIYDTDDLGPSYISIPGSSTLMMTNVCYSKPMENCEKNIESTHHPKNRNCKISLSIIIPILCVISITALSVSLYLKFASTDSRITSLQMELNLLRNNYSQAMELLTSLQTTGTHPLLPAESCASIHEAAASSPSGYYWVRSNSGVTFRVFCNMETVCGGRDGGWMRVADLNMVDESMMCPKELTETVFLNNTRVCALPTPSENLCVSIFYNTERLTHSRVCGRILGYQFGSPDSFFKEDLARQTIDTNYVDGVSLTRGNPKEHIWTFASGHCRDNCSHFAPLFIGNNYFCDGVEYPHCTRFCNVTLWNGQQCSKDEMWFYRQLSQHKDEEIELRVCQDEGSSSEQTPLVQVELYIQ